MASILDGIVGTDIVPVGPAPAGDNRRHGCRNAGCDWVGPRRNMDQNPRTRGNGARIIGLNCPKCGRWIIDA